MKNPIVLMVAKKIGELSSKVKVSGLLLFFLITSYFGVRYFDKIDSNSDIDTLVRLLIFYLLFYFAINATRIYFLKINQAKGFYDICNCPMALIKKPFFYFFINKFGFLFLLLMAAFLIFVIFISFYALGIGIAVLLTANIGDKKYAVLMFLIFLPSMYLSMKSLLSLREIRKIFKGIEYANKEN